MDNNQLIRPELEDDIEENLEILGLINLVNLLELE